MTWILVANTGGYPEAYNVRLIQVLLVLLLLLFPVYRLLKRKE